MRHMGEIRGVTISSMPFYLNVLFTYMAPQNWRFNRFIASNATCKRTKDDGLLGGGTVRVDKVDGGIDRGVSRLGKNAIHLDSLFLKNKNCTNWNGQQRHRRSCEKQTSVRRKSDDEESRGNRRNRGLIFVRLRRTS